MGTDIHMCAEVLPANWVVDEEHKFWDEVGAVFKNPYYRPEQNDYPWEEFTDAPYKGRNYDLFGFLADVRNGVGFAGVDTGDPIKPLAAGRGWPEGVWSDFRDRHGNGQEDGNYHSHSYLTLTELLAADWEASKVSRMYVSPEDFLAYRKTGEPPTSGWGGMFGNGVFQVNETEYDSLSEEDKDRLTGVRIQFSYPIRKAAGSFYTETIPALRDLLSLPKLRHVKKYVGEGKPGEPGERKLVEYDIEPTTDQVRIIFCFDS